MLAQIQKALDRAKERGECIVLYAHHISDGVPRDHLSPAVLDRVLGYAATIGLRFYTFDDLP